MTRERRLKWVALFTICCAGAFILLNVMGDGVSVANMAVMNNLQKKQRLDSVYEMEFPLEKNAPGSMNLFIPAYIQCEKGTAEAMTALFGDFSPWWETDEAFLFENEQESLTIHKRISLIEYRMTKRQNGGNTVTAEEAVAIAERFLQERMIYLSYDSITALKSDKGYAISFIDRLNGYDNYGFPSTLKVDLYGNVYDMDYYYFNYDNFESCALMNMEDAYYGLPLDFVDPNTDEKQVVLTSCKLVYIYENSIVQPAYMFMGEMIGQDKSFTCYVKAAVYNN